MTSPGLVKISGAPEGGDALALGEIATTLDRPVLFVACNDVRMARMAETLGFFVPGLNPLQFPAWDCLPYDRISPNPEILSRRIEALGQITEGRVRGETQVVLTTISALLQRVPPHGALEGATFGARKGEHCDLGDLTARLGLRGYTRVEIVTEPGEYAVRGGIVDVFPPGYANPVRLDFFGDDLEGMRVFEPDSQRTTEEVEAVRFRPMSEILLNERTIALFRSEYRALFGAVGSDDPLYAAVSAGRRQSGMEHWLPLFYDHLDTLFDYLPGAVVILDHQLDDARDMRLEMIADYYDARLRVKGGEFSSGGSAYNPVPPERLYLDREQLDTRLADFSVGSLSPFAAPEGPARTIDLGGRPSPDFAEARKRPGVNVFDALAERCAQHREQGRRVIIAAVTRGSRERLRTVLEEHGMIGLVPLDRWDGLQSLGDRSIGMAVLGLDRGFVLPDTVIISEQDILGDRMIRQARRRKRAENFLTEASSLNPGDLVVHIDHGIGCYEGLETISVSDAPHDCIRILYAGGDRLYLPVENIELISRYGSESEAATLDRLGGASWQGRKARLKQRIRDMADALIKVAAARSLKTAPVMTPPEGLFDEFCARFPYLETDDQYRAISDVIDDLASGRPSDRLICGDVGFGKTEVALRAAFVTAMQARQVAVVVPTTLLCRQHFRTFAQRFSGYPLRIEELSRLVPPKQAKAVKAGLAGGTTDVIIGTHALLAKDVAFRDLGLLVIDEEQHFGVANKEKLKKLRAEVHVLTLSATPIPRTLQMALTGVRDLSLIATPPLDRLAVRTFVMEFDPVVIREALLREHHRGGQSFYVCPRIEDLDAVCEELTALVPEVKLVVAHGRMSGRDLETSVGKFYDGAFDVLVSTNIIESGLDLPAVNTIVIHRADMFGLAQLYQLRGRVGRGKVRAYAYLTLPSGRQLTASAQKRLEVMQALDALGAGFSLASYDLDIRGAGNLLGEEQSGHIREVGVELYQHMLEEAVVEARAGDQQHPTADEWSPQINIGLSVLIPDTYVPDLGVRLGLYRRLGDMHERVDIDGFAAELVDRFGNLPDEVSNLLQVVAIKQMCRKAGVEKLEAGPRGAVVSFRDNLFANPAGLVQFISAQAGTVKLRPDHKLVYRRNWETTVQRLEGVRLLTAELARIAAAEVAA